LIRLRKRFFIICVERIFTTSGEPLFTNVFNVIAEIDTAACLCRAGNAD
jgi:hypothetical protein